jgi:hypothetical protein
MSNDNKGDKKLVTIVVEGLGGHPNPTINRHRKSRH